MTAKTHTVATDLHKVEVGEIDTTAPFRSVRAAVSLFGESATSFNKLSIKKSKTPQSERVLARETELHLAQQELKKYKEQLHNAETTRTQALTELDLAKKTVSELMAKLAEVNSAKELAIKATEDAKSCAAQLEVGDGVAKDGVILLDRDLQNAKEQHVAALSDLEAAKQDFWRLKKDVEVLSAAKAAASQEETEAKRASATSEEKAADLTKEIAVIHKSLVHENSAIEQARGDESDIRAEKEAAKRNYRDAIEEAERKLCSLRKELDLEAYKALEAELEATTMEIAAVQKKIEDSRAARLASVAAANVELADAKETLRKLEEEEISLRASIELLKAELEAARSEHGKLRQKDAETEAAVGDLHEKLRLCRAELEAAIVIESDVVSSSEDLSSALQQLAAESEAASQEAEAMRKNAGELRVEAEAARHALTDAEKKLAAALLDAEEAKAAEARALRKIREMSEKASAARTSTSEAEGSRITISREEFESLSRKAEESEKLAEMKVTAAMTQVEAIRASESEVAKKMEAAEKEMKEVEAATAEAERKAAMAEAAKKAVEGELRRWRERDERKAAEMATRIIASPPPMRKKTLVPALSGMFHRKKKEGEASPSYLPGERPV